ncbi:putative GH43/DUF377 family glycosyl hydrolase [Flavobacterium sp. CG_9.1]|uniref:glycoside hydrolase family 130 protein n=1 Tax=Flavobacterium sp. CG_9.1 TaxID=2787728 RepID=UPI0018CBE491|nr:glycoside hydrolase family 130 protein [Flavobacterium sp. CG_9.1]MBG6061054.1 putative GH43/DUF377 family glycosyl hydrolase [Flavobacterium sp. CG_9.1]
MKLTITLLLVVILDGCGSVSEYRLETKTKDWAVHHFVKVDSLNSILEPEFHQVFQSPISNKQVHWEERNVLNPFVIVKNGKAYLIYRAQDKDLKSKLGLAINDDGLHFKKQPLPIFCLDNDTIKQYEWQGGIEETRIIESENGTYIMTYTSYDGKTARLCLASSKDLYTWTKHGLVLKEEKYKDLRSQSGAIVCKLAGNKIIAAKIKGKYWMYFGDNDLYLATYEDLIHWNVAENDENKKMISVLHPRMGYFDSRLVEPGPLALVQKEGILLIYNDSNAANYNDSNLPKFTIAVSQALFDKENPYKFIDRMDDYFSHPDKPYEQTGEVNEVYFVEGLVYFKKK